MENASNALIMAASVLLFILGLSVGVYLYSRMLDLNSQILTNSEYYDKTAERFDYTLKENNNYIVEDVTRTIQGAEVANQILELVKDPYGSEIARQKNDFKYNEIIVSGKHYKRGDSILNLNSATLSKELLDISSKKYTIKKYKFNTDSENKSLVTIEYIVKVGG